MPPFELLPFIVGIISALGGVYLLTILSAIVFYPIVDNALDSDRSYKFVMVALGSAVLSIALPFMVYGIAWYVYPEYAVQPWFIVGFTVAAVANRLAN